MLSIMSRVKLEQTVSSLVVIATILQFLSGVLVCRQYVANKTTAEASVLPFVSGMLACCLWFLYGILKRDNIIVLVNTIGFTLMVSYTSVFYIYSFKKSTVLKQVFVTVGIIIFALWYVCTEEDNEGLFSTLGLAACSFTLLTIAAPMSKLLHVIRVRSTECLPFPMILMSFIVSMLWYLYGYYLKEDIYVWMPNYCGTILAVSQLLLFVIFPNKSQTPISVKSSIA